MVGDNSLVLSLRILTSIELFLHCDYYVQHPCFLSIVNKHGKYFKNINNLLPLSVSKEGLDTGMTKADLVKQEAILNCNDKKWSSFLCILALSSVLGRNIYTYYPDCGEERYRLFLNCLVKPRLPTKHNFEDLHILFCFEGCIKPGDTFLPNHFVPLLFYSNQLKRKLQVPESKSTTSKKKTPTMPSKILKRSGANIKQFFSVSQPVHAQPTHQKPCNETFSSPAAASTSVNVHVLPQPTHQKAPNETFSSPAAYAAAASTSVTVPQESGELTRNQLIYVTGSSFDVSLFREKVKGMDSPQILNLVKNVFKPDKQFSFPKTNGRCFRYNWLELHSSWLCYSPLKDGAYCLSCVLFGDRFPGRASKLKNLFSEPLRRWNDAASAFRRHVGHGTGGEMGLHACTFPLLTNLLSQLSGATQPIEIIIDSNLKKEVAENRKKLEPIVDAVTLCGRLGLPLRGHRDDAKYHPEVGGFSSGGIGNFVQILNFRVRGGDETLKDHLITCGKNRSYISKTSQNKIIRCCGQVIREQLLSEIKENKFYSIIADEAKDSSHKEQMSLVLRFVDSNCDIREEFIAFLHCKWGLSGAQLAQLLLEALNDLTLPVEDCRGQGYDGAGSVAGHINGLSAQILKLNKKALYTHCYSHRLNLSVCDSISIAEVTKMFKQVKDLSHFINVYQTRNIPFEENIKTFSSESESRKSKLVDVCRTRWVDRVQGLDTFQELFVPLYRTLEEMSENKGEIRFPPALIGEASNCLTVVSRFDFIAALIITRHILDSTLSVTQLLQGKSIDIMDGIHLITTLKNSVVKMRNSVDSVHDTWYCEVLELANELGIEEWKPRNKPSDTISDYYKFTITIPLLDHLHSSLDARFDIDSINVYKGLSIVPAKMQSLLSNGIDWKEEFKTAANFYHDDLPNPLALDAELFQWQTYWETFIGPLPDNIATTLKSVSFEGFENIKVLLRILGTLPITSCECERSISALRTLKNYKRSTMVEERLNGLALMQIHQEISPDFKKIIDKFAEGNTRLKFN